MVEYWFEDGDYIDLKIINYGSGDGQYAESGESREALVAHGSSDSEYGALSVKYQLIWVE